MSPSRQIICDLLWVRLSGHTSTETAVSSTQYYGICIQFRRNRSKCKANSKTIDLSVVRVRLFKLAQMANNCYYKRDMQ